MPKADADAVDPQGSGSPVTNVTELRARAGTEREAALQRAFGDHDEESLFDDDEVAGSTEETEVIEPEPESASTPAETAQVAELNARLARLESALESRVEAERERQETVSAEELDYVVEGLPEGWEAAAPAIQAVGKRAVRTEVELAKMAEQSFALQARLDLLQFKSDHPDFQNLSDTIAKTAERERLDLYDYKSLKVVYDLVKGRAAVAELGALKKREATQKQMAEKAGPAPRFRSPQQQVRDENISPGNKLLSFEDSWNKGLAKVQTSRRRS